MTIPVCWIFAHEFGYNREYRESIQGQVRTPQRQCRRHVDIVNFALLLFLRWKRGRREFGEGRVGGIESKRSRLGYGYVDMDIFVKVWLKTVIRSQFSTRPTLSDRFKDLRELAKL